jgi:excisionase family DNA binding protein
MTTPADDELITLDEAAKLIPGADAGTLRRLCRKGLLRCYRPGKAYLTTRADVWEAVKRSQVGPKVRIETSPNSIELANAALDAALQASVRRKKR